MWYKRINISNILNVSQMHLLHSIQLSGQSYQWGFMFNDSIFIQRFFLIVTKILVLLYLWRHLVPLPCFNKRLAEAYHLMWGE